MSIRSLLTTTILILGVLMTTTPVRAQSDSGDANQPAPAPTALEQAKADAEMRKAVADAKKAAIEAEQAALAAALPTSDTTGSTGEVEIENAGYYAEILAYRTLSTAANTIVAKAPPPENASDAQKTVIITTETDLSESSYLWELVNAKLDGLTKRVGKATEKLEAIDSIAALRGEEAAGALLAAAPAILGGIADIAAFFKTDRKLIGRTVTLDELALVAEVSGKLKEGRWQTVVVPGLNVRESGPIVDQINQLIAGRQGLAAELDRIREQVVQTSLDDLKSKKAKLETLKAEREAAKQSLAEKTKKLAKLKSPQEQEEIERTNQEIDELEARIAQLDGEGGKVDLVNEEVLHLQAIEDDWTRLKGSTDEVLTSADAYLDTLTSVQGENPSPVSTLRQVDQIRAYPEATVVSVKIVSQGSEIHVSKSKFTSGRISYVGGSVCVYFVVNPKGELVAAGTVPVSLADSFKFKDAATGASFAPQE